MDINELFLWIFGGGTVLAVIVSILITLICTIVPIGGVVWFLLHRKKQSDQLRQSSQTWRATSGKVLKSRVEVSGGEMTSVSPRVIYEYEVMGRRYENDQIKAGDKFLRVGGSRDAYQTIDRYPEGMDVTVYYNPANPAESALER